MDILDGVKTILKITGSDNDTLLTLYIDIVTQQILTVTNRKSLPQELRFTLIQMVADLYWEQTAKTLATSTGGTVASISEDGRTVGFQKTLATEIQTAAEDRINRKNELYQYRLPYRS